MNKPQTIKEAFHACLQIRGVYKKIGLDKSTVSHMKSKMRYGDFPSDQTMKDVLKKMGYKIVQLELWEHNKEEKIIFHLNLTGEWFDLIEKEIKLEEYRLIKPHWSRVFNGNSIKIKGKWYHSTEVIICFSNGYAKNRRQLFVKCEGLSTGFGNPEWGAVENVEYYKLKLGEIIK